MSRIVGIVALLALVWWAASAPVSAQEPCKFVLGFAALRDLVGAEKVGRCLEDEHFNTENGNAEQHAAGGLMVWRKIDNFTAFTDGGTSWINGPNGLQSRPNNERFSWEKDPVQAAPQTAAAPTTRAPINMATAQAGVEATSDAINGPARATRTADTGRVAATSTARTAEIDATVTAVISQPTKTPIPAATARPVSSGSGDKNCSDFKSQADAQAELRAHPEDRYGLDTDKDGIACEGNKAPKDTKKVPR